MYCICKKYDDYDDDLELELELDFQFQQEELNRMFPDAKFTIALSLDELDDVISPLDKIIVKQTFNCYCYGGVPASDAPVPRWFPIHCDEGEKMTKRVVIRELVRQGLSLDCNHRFLEGFIRSGKGGECQFEMVLGS